MTQEDIEQVITSYVDGELNNSNVINEIKDLIEKDKKLNFDYRVQLFIKSIVSEKLKIEPVPDRIKSNVLKKIKPSKSFFKSIFYRILS